jgi:hypothetical protein
VHAQKWRNGDYRVRSSATSSTTNLTRRHQGFPSVCLRRGTSPLTCLLCVCVCVCVSTTNKQTDKQPTPWLSGGVLVLVWEAPGPNCQVVQTAAPVISATSNVSCRRRWHPGLQDTNTSSNLFSKSQFYMFRVFGTCCERTSLRIPHAWV